MQPSSVALDESTDISDRAQLIIFIRATTAGFNIFEKHLDMSNMTSPTTGQDICEQVIKVVETFELKPVKLCGLTTDEASSMTGGSNGFITKFLDAIGAQDVVVTLCIIH